MRLGAQSETIPKALLFTTTTKNKI